MQLRRASDRGRYGPLRRLTENSGLTGALDLTWPWMRAQLGFWLKVSLGKDREEFKGTDVKQKLAGVGTGSGCISEGTLEIGHEARLCDLECHPLAF